MPYITEHDREQINSGQQPPSTPGELNYAITCMLIKYLQANGTRYQTINDCLGALEGAKAEFYRRVAVPFEEYKRRTNGDVYPPDLLPAEDES